MQTTYAVSVEQIVDGKCHISHWMKGADSLEEAEAYARQQVEEFNAMSKRIGSVHFQRFVSVEEFDWANF